MEVVERIRSGMDVERNELWVLGSRFSGAVYYIFFHFSFSFPQFARL
jgi:hypothetical protein